MLFASFCKLHLNAADCFMEVHRNVSQKESLDLLGFTRSVVGRMLTKPNACFSGPSGKRICTNSDYYYPEPVEKHGRCAFCKRNTRMKCLGCDALLHALCFRKYHEKFVIAIQSLLFALFRAVFLSKRARNVNDSDSGLDHCSHMGTNKQLRNYAKLYSNYEILTSDFHSSMLLLMY